MHIELVNVVDLVGRQRFMNINWQNLLFRIRYKLSAMYHCTDIQLVNISACIYCVWVCILQINW